jgi:uncharacterized Fe-S cluster-containing radical SAM superfamily protein
MAQGERPAANPTTAVVAVTDRCDARCVMCDIWQRAGGPGLPPGAYRRLPSSLRVVNLTGGEPFLRPDLAEVVIAVRQACPQARQILSTNGLALPLIRHLAPSLARIDPALAVRVSIDGLGALHDRLRGVPGAYARALQALDSFQQAGISDLGISMTLMADNVEETVAVYNLAEELGIEFSLTLVSESPIYYGLGKSSLRPSSAALVQRIAPVIRAEYRHWHPGVARLRSRVARRPAALALRCRPRLFLPGPGGRRLWLSPVAEPAGQPGRGGLGYPVEWTSGADGAPAGGRLSRLLAGVHGTHRDAQAVMACGRPGPRRQDRSPPARQQPGLRILRRVRGCSGSGPVRPGSRFCHRPAGT